MERVRAVHGVQIAQQSVCHAPRAHARRAIGSLGRCEARCGRCARRIL